MKKWMVSFILLVGLSMALTSPVSADITDENIPTAIEIIRQINEFRVENGLYPYTFNRTLALAAQDHSEWQADNRVVQHTGLDGSNEHDRNIIRGYDQGVSTFKVDEMVYGGFSATPDIAMDFWTHSPVHYPLVVSEVYHEIGVGVAINGDGQKFYTVNIGMIPGITSPGPSEYRAPTEAEYKPPKNVPIRIAEPQDDGAIYHTYVEGQTMAAIAEAYGISLDTLLLLNDLSANSTPNDGVLLLIKQPTDEPILVQTSTPTYTPFPSSTPTRTTAADATTVAEATATEEADAGIIIQPTGTSISSSGGRETTFPWPWVIIAGLFVVAAGGGIYWYLPNLRKTAQEEGILDDGDDRDDKHHGDFAAAHRSSTARFDHLPRSEQSALLAEAAKEALEAYPLEVVSVDLLRYVLNAEFLVSAIPSGGSEPREYVLRVNAPGFHSRAEIDSELEWLRAIIRDTRLTVPEPVRASNGEWVTSVDLPQLGIWRYCVLFTYIDAKSVKDEIEPKQMEFLGALIAVLHRHGETYQPSKGFIRKHWDLEGLKGEMLDVPPSQAYAALSEEERQVVDDAEKIVREGMDSLGHDPKVYGLIHGDLHLKSMLFSGGRPVVIDFDTCGYGYYIYDLSVAIWDIFHRDDFAEMRRALLSGYRKVRQLSEQEEALLMHFVAGRLMAQILTWTPRREHSPLTEIADKAIEKQVHQLERLVDYLER